MTEDELRVLESKLDQLISLCTQLNQENTALKTENENWRREKQGLIEKNKLASNKVEAMIDRLRAIE
jgi:cell division protein ZapB